MWRYRMAQYRRIVFASDRIQVQIWFKPARVETTSNWLLLSSPLIQMNVTRRLVFALACLFLVSVEAKAVIISGFDAARHSRFLANGDLNPAFFIDEGDISGIASNNDLNDPQMAFNRAALITPQHYIAATHAGDLTPTFRGSDGIYRTYNSSGRTVMKTLFNGSLVDSDLSVYRLDAPIPTSHGVTPMALLAGDPFSVVGEEVYVIGQNNRAGRNIAEQVILVTFENNASPTISFRYSYDTDNNGGTGGLGVDEAGLQGGDSGHSALIRIGDEFALLGAHMGIDPPTGPGSGNVYNSFTSLVTPYLDQIQTATLADGFDIRTLTVTAVPEPNTMLAMSIGALLVMRRRRRNVVEI